MTLDEFWYGDTRLLDAYQKAYYRDKSYTAWINGARIFEANSKISANENRRKTTDKVEQYSEWKDPFENKVHTKMSEETLEQKFRESQYKQNAWLFRN